MPDVEKGAHGVGGLDTYDEIVDWLTAGVLVERRGCFSGSRDFGLQMRIHARTHVFIIRDLLTVASEGRAVELDIEAASSNGDAVSFDGDLFVSSLPGVQVVLLVEEKRDGRRIR